MGNLNTFTMTALEQECKFEKLAEQEEILEEQKEDDEMKLRIEQETNKDNQIKREFEKKD